jgi:AraC family transcriptional activator of pyochelin receptor
MSERIGVIKVSPEMITLLGDIRPEDGDVPVNSTTLLVKLDRPASVRIVPDSIGLELPADCSDRTITMIVKREALSRLFGWLPQDSDDEYFLDAELAGIADQILGASHGPEAQTTYRLGKSIELLCEVVVRIKEGKLQRAHRDLTLSQVDSQRLGAALAIIEAQWSEKLTIGLIAHRCGLNRTKLSRGFRELYRCSVSEALANRRLAEARRQLLATDLPVSVIGYRSGYSNNASFSRAFGRRFGQSPSELRSSGVAS